jgi:hypothetical protein
MFLLLERLIGSMNWSNATGWLASLLIFSHHSMSRLQDLLMINKYTLCHVQNLLMVYKYNLSHVHDFLMVYDMSNDSLTALAC